MRVLAAGVAVVLAVVLAVTLPGDVPAFAEPAPEWDRPAPEVTDVPVSEVEPAARPAGLRHAAAVSGESRVDWPEPGTARVALPERARAFAGAGDLPVRVAATGLAGAAPGAVQVRVADRAATAAAGVHGLLVSVARADGLAAPASAAVAVDYSGFRHAYGGDWASRLRVSVLGAGPVPTTNDYRAGVLVATVPLPAGGEQVTLAVAAAPSGDNGDYTATDLSPAATWQVSQQSGDFGWSYPLRVVPGVGGPEPELALSYSSGGLDGRTAATNTQPSWVGDGWDLWPGYIERDYRLCLEDQDPVGGQEPNNRDRDTGDLCWYDDNATLSLNGRATELVRGSGDRWHATTDDGSRIERLTDASLGNGARGGEFWRVTTMDGTQYYFGRHRRQGFPTDTAATGSTWTAPVYGNHPGEPCYQAGDYDGSRCNQAWRWNLDYVVDPHGNSMTLFYQQETGAYARELEPDRRTTYDRGGTLARIEYGTRAGQEHTTPAPMRVVFEVADRCKPGASCTASNPSAWPDTPWDQFCDSAPCTEQLAPTFWTQKRLSRVLAQVRSGTAYTTVESWTLRHEWLDVGAWAGEGIPMWLRGITRTGHVGAAVADPEIVFDPGGEPLANRVDGPSDNRSSLARWRIRTITTETGAQIGIGYSSVECARSSLPTPHTNGKRCFPQWYGPYDEEPTLDWFHKYVVTRVDVHDNTGAAGHQQTNYQYLDDPAWHYDDTPLVLPKHRTWGQWRGYSQVRVVEGLPTETQSRTDYRYLRGMHGDRAGPSGGTKSVEVPDSQGGTITDHEAFAGFLREETTYNGGSWVTGSIHTPWRHGPTASDGTLQAWLTGSAQTRTRTALAAGGVRWTRQDTAFDTSYGLPTQVDDHGDESTTADDLCTRYQYARNTSKWIVDRVSREETVSVRCAATPSRPADVVADERTYYDDPADHGAVPSRGLPVRTEEVGSWNGSTPVWVTTGRTGYDSQGREVEARDALDRRTTTAYTPATGGPVTRTVVTNPLGHTETTVLAPAWGLPTRITDANQRVTDLTYDGLGRLTAVWAPGQDKGTDAANMKFSYLVRNDRPTAVTTQELQPDLDGDTYRTTIVLFDGSLRERQTQTLAPGGGRVIEDTVYDSRGLVDWESKGYFNSGAPSTNLVTTAGQPQIPGITDLVHDGAERVAAEVYLVNGAERWRTGYTYGGDRVHLTPPAGGTATTTIKDARDRTVALRQYHGPTPTGTYDETSYSYAEPSGEDLASVVDAAGNEWTFDYDQRGREVFRTDPAAGATTTTYDAAGQITRDTDASGVTVAYGYDALGRRTTIREGSATGPKLAEWVYDTLPGGVGELTRAIRYENGAAYANEVVGYDAAGRPTGTRVVIPAAEVGLAGTYTTTTQYYPDGSVGLVQLPALGDLPDESLEHGYNDVGAPTFVVSEYVRYVDEVLYNKLGNLTQRVLGNHGSRVQLTHVIEEATGRLQATAATRERPQDATLMDLHYGYDAAGNLTRIADTRGTAAPVDTQCYRYDHLRRLTDAWTPSATGTTNCQPAPAVGALGGPAPYWRSWSYDQAGNRLSQTAHAAGGDTVTRYAHPEPGGAQPHAVATASSTGPGRSQVDSFRYDAAGNMTGRTVAGVDQILAWDPQGRLASVTEDGAGGTVTSYLYDAGGERLIRRDATGKTLYLPNGQELRYDTATGRKTGTRYYEHAGVTVAVRTGGGLTWLVGDHHGTAEAAVGAADLSVQRRRTLPFGQTRGAVPAAWAGDRGFVDGTEDPTGLTHLGAREYDPALGRFISVDPLVDYFDPQRMHPYAYGNNAPPTFDDPDGEFFGSLWKKAEKFAKSDTFKAVTQIAVGVAVGVAVGGLCAATAGVGCVIAAGVVGGMAGAAYGYGIDAAHRGGVKASPREVATNVMVSGAVGGVTAGVGSKLPLLKGALTSRPAPRHAAVRAPAGRHKDLNAYNAVPGSHKYLGPVPPRTATPYGYQGLHKDYGPVPANHYLGRYLLPSTRPYGVLHRGVPGFSGAFGNVAGVGVDVSRSVFPFFKKKPASRPRPRPAPRDPRRDEPKPRCAACWRLPDY